MAYMVMLLSTCLSNSSTLVYTFAESLDIYIKYVLSYSSKLINAHMINHITDDVYVYVIHITDDAHMINARRLDKVEDN